MYYVRGFPVGAALDGKHFLFNHIKLVISYNEDHSPGNYVYIICIYVCVCIYIYVHPPTQPTQPTHHPPSTNQPHQKTPEAQRKFKHSRIVGFLVEPYSIKHSYEGTWPTDPDAVRFLFFFIKYM